MQDSYQHLRITGVPYAVVNSLNASTCTRSFLDDPESRLYSEHINNETRPHSFDSGGEHGAWR